MDKNRKDFEAWMTEMRPWMSLKTFAGGYLHKYVDELWICWQASSIQALQEVAARAPARSEATCGLAGDRGPIEHQQVAAIRSLEGNAPAIEPEFRAAVLELDREYREGNVTQAHGSDQ